MSAAAALPSLFDRPDPAAVEVSTQEAMRRAEAHASGKWRAAAYSAVVACSIALPKGFTADDVWPLVEQALGSKGLDANPAALGPIFLRASRDGVIRKTGRSIKTRFKRRHRELTEWQREAP